MKRSRLAWCVALAFLGGLLPFIVIAQGGGASAPAGGSAITLNATVVAACIAPAVRGELESCPTAAPRPVQGRATAPTQHLKATKRQEEAKKQGPTGPAITLDMATRTNREQTAVREETLLRREVEVLRRLVANTRTDDPRRPDVLLRLAETYFEYQQSYNTKSRGLDQPLFEAQQAGNTARVQQIQQQQQEAQTKFEELRQKAIETYAVLVQDHPTYRRMDEVLFSLAFGLEEMRQFDRARQVYHRLIKGYPQSRFIPNAYLSFAEYYFNEGGLEGMQSAIRFYEKVREIPPESNPVYGYSIYKSAWASYNLEDYRAALQSFEDVVTFATANPTARDAENLARQSRKELVLPYSRVGGPDRALEYFQRLAKDQAGANDMFESLGELYYDTGKWAETINVYHKLMAEQPNNDKLCYWQTRVSNAVISSKPKREQLLEVQRMVDLYETYMGQTQRAETARGECKQATASTLVELATAWHREAIGTEAQPGTNDRNTMELSAQMYRLVLDKFPEMEEMEFPNIDRRDWPTNYKVSYYYAELLWKMEKWGECGPAFDKVVDLNPQGDFTADAAYGAVLCYNNVYQTQIQGRERQLRDGGGAAQGQQTKRGRRGRQAQPEPQDDAVKYATRDFTQLENGMLNAFQRYVCFVPDSEDLVTIKYRRARIYYESNRFEQAALLFKDIAWNNRSSDLAEYAANLYLDSMNVIGGLREEKRPECYTQMEDDLEPLGQMFCADDNMRASHDDLCATIDKLKCGLLRKKAEAFEASARSHQGRNEVALGIEEFKKAARMYVDLYRKFKDSPDACGGDMDEVLWNAAINFEAAKLIGKAIQVRKVLIADFPASELAKRSMFLIGANYHALAIYDQAADYYEQFAKKYPGEMTCSDEDRAKNACTVAPEALQNAVFFRLGRGETEKAIADARLFETSYKTRLPRDTSKVVFSVGSIYKAQQDWTRVVNHYKSFLSSYARIAMPQQVIRANVEIGNAYLAVNDRAKAEPFFRAAVARWERNAAADIAALDVAGDKTPLVDEAKDAAAEAYFRLADTKFEEFKKVRFPTFTGAATAARVTQWATADFVTWLGRKQTALQTAETAFNLVAALEVPQWQIAAAARAGEMFRTVVDEVRSAPIPDEISRDPELEGIYIDTQEALLNGSVPGPDNKWDTEDDIRCSPESQEDTCKKAPLRQAVERFGFCLITATRVRWFNEFSRQCELELNRLSPVEYPLAAEIRGQSAYVFEAPARPEAVELGATAESEDATPSVPTPPATTPAPAGAQ